MEKTPEKHMTRVKSHLKKGREFISAVRRGKETLRTCNVPVLQIRPDVDMLKKKAPLAGDRCVFCSRSAEISLADGY